ncbi:NAD(P)-dependent oxidoreductase [Pelagibacteraceae bacterium]|nr:NAD(P)-dependent oxidoreductase [Pelagibacteraceae bacterium]
MPDPKVNVAFIGTGLMGLPMVKNLSKGGYKIRAFNRTLYKMDELKNINNISICSSLDEAIIDAAVIITALPDDNAVEKTINEIINKDLLSQGSIFVDTSSTKYESAKKFYNILKEKKINFIDAPISGGPEGAKSASLAIMAGGDNEIFDRVKDILKTMGNPTLVGPAGSGQVAKLCNQIIVGVTIGAVAEAIILCEKVGANPENFIKAVAGGFADSKILQNHGSRMIEKDFAPRGKSITHLKDMNNILKCAEDMNVNLPISKLIQDMYQNLVDRGLGNDDHSALYKEIIERNKKK